jgi:hypothetical protein
MQNELMTLLIQNETSWGRAATAPPTPGHEHVLLGVPVNSPTTVLRGKGPARGRRVAPYHRIKVRSASLYKVIEDSIYSSIGAWWASYTTALPAKYHMPWGELHAAFRGHHLSAGTMHCKLTEFLNLHQGNRSVYEYTQEFNNLAWYRGHHVDTDVKKADRFGKGLTIQLQDRLTLSQNLSYNKLASAAID